VAILLDTHILLELIGSGRAAEGEWGSELVHVSVASLWEVAIKVRQGKLRTPISFQSLESRLEELGWTTVPITAVHAVAEVDPWPDTRDPFDRLLLAVCRIENLRLVTRDRKLVDHPLAWRPPSA
jgi:PIN domain nuclease of toxin-antitoxin system